MKVAEINTHPQTPEEAYNEALFEHLKVQNRRLAECESALFVNRLIVIAALVLLVAHLFTAST